MNRRSPPRIQSCEGKKGMGSKGGREGSTGCSGSGFSGCNRTRDQEKYAILLKTLAETKEQTDNDAQNLDPNVMLDNVLAAFQTVVAAEHPAPSSDDFLAAVVSTGGAVGLWGAAPGGHVSFSATDQVVCRRNTGALCRALHTATAAWKSPRLRHSTPSTAARDA